MCFYLLYMYSTFVPLTFPQVTVLGLIALWFRQQREQEVGCTAEVISLPDKSKLFEALQRLPISFGMAMRVGFGLWPPALPWGIRCHDQLLYCTLF